MWRVAVTPPIHPPQRAGMLHMLCTGPLSTHLLFQRWRNLAVRISFLGINAKSWRMSCGKKNDRSGFASQKLTTNRFDLQSTYCICGSFWLPKWHNQWRMWTYSSNGKPSSPKSTLHLHVGCWKYSSSTKALYMIYHIINIPPYTLYNHKYRLFYFCCRWGLVSLGHICGKRLGRRCWPCSRV